MKKLLQVKSSSEGEPFKVLIKHQIIFKSPSIFIARRVFICVQRPYKIFQLLIFLSDLSMLIIMAILKVKKIFYHLV
jgi:hypothetical protein